MLVSQRIVQVCLFLVAAVAAVAVLGGTLQMYLGQPETSPRLDNVHRFMAGVYLATGVISFWAARTIRRQGTLVGLPKPAAVWLAYLTSELLLAVVIAVAHKVARRPVS
jgi:hypothetical protein